MIQQCRTQFPLYSYTQHRQHTYIRCITLFMAFKYNFITFNNQQYAQNPTITTGGTIHTPRTQRQCLNELKCAREYLTTNYYDYFVCLSRTRIINYNKSGILLPIFICKHSSCRKKSSLRSYNINHGFWPEKKIRTFNLNVIRFDACHAVSISLKLKTTTTTTKRNGFYKLGSTNILKKNLFKFMCFYS